MPKGKIGQKKAYMLKNSNIYFKITFRGTLQTNYMNQLSNVLQKTNGVGIFLKSKSIWMNLD